jgi:hypothetical protein
MTYKEKLIEFHLLAKEKLKVCLIYETKVRDQDELCDDICDAQHLEKRMQMYAELQNALNDRNELARKVNEGNIDINSEYIPGQVTSIGEGN